MIPIKINIWGNFIDTDAKKGRLIVKQKPNSFHFLLYMYYDDEPYPFDEWLETIASIEYTLVVKFVSIVWEDDAINSQVGMPYFMPDKLGKIVGLGRFKNTNITLWQTLTAGFDPEDNIPDNIPAWLIDISSNCGNIKHTECIIQPSTMAYFFELYDIKIDYPKYFDLECIEGIFSAINYWKNYIFTYDYAQKELSSLVTSLTNKLAINTFKFNVKNIKNILQAWHTQPQSEQKLSNIARYEKCLAQCLVIEPIQNKIATLKTLTKSRPLLAREQVELEILQGILAAQTEAEIDTIISQIKATPTDAELRKILTAQAEARRSLIVDNNIEGI